MVVDNAAAAAVVVVVLVVVAVVVASCLLNVETIKIDTKNVFTLIEPMSVLY